MAVEKSYARLGLFLVVVLVVVLATALLFIQRWRSRAVIGMVTYTNENVSGLEVSSPVRFRGVSLGRVSDVRVDPRDVIVEIDFEMFPDRLNTIGISTERIGQIRDLRGMFPNLRASMVSNPVTGEAYLLLDVPENPPPPMTLAFTPDRPYVPWVPTTLATVQDRLPAILERAEAALQTVTEIVSKVPESLDRSNRFFTNVERIFQESELPALSTQSSPTVTSDFSGMLHPSSNTRRPIRTPSSRHTTIFIGVPLNRARNPPMRIASRTLAIASLTNSARS